MKVLQILPELNVGGVETGTIDFAKYLVEHGHQSMVVSNGGELVAALESQGSKHYTLPVHKKSLWTIIQMIKPLRKIIREEKVDIVHARSRVPAWIAYFACRKTNASFITTCHGFYKNHFFSRIMGRAKLVIVPSQAIARHMIDHYGVPASGIRCIPRGVDLSKFPSAKEYVQGKSSYIVASIGRITPLKGHTYFLQAMAQVIRLMPYVKVWIIGSPPRGKEYYQRELEMLATRLGIKDHVEFLGNRRDIPELFKKIDLLVLSTVTPESFGRVILEAQVMGVPVVATRVGGVVDIIEDGKTGILVTAKDPETMAKEVTRVLNDKRLGQNFVEEAQKKLKENFTLEKMAERTLAVYEELLQSTRILVIKIGSLGDVILVTASLRALRARFPKAKIFCLVGKDSRKILQNCPYLDGMIVYDPKHKDKGWMKLFKLARKLRKYRFDKIIDFQNNRKSHLLSYLSLAEERYGHKNGKWSFLLTHRAEELRQDLPPVEHQFEVLKLLGIPYKEKNYLELWPSTEDKQRVDRLLDEEWLGNARNIIGINISASERWPTKNWPLEYIAQLCDMLTQKNIRVVITGTERDKAAAQRILSLTKSKPSILTGKTDIVELACLIKKCKVYLTPDSAPLHVAAAVDTPIITFFGPTDSKRHCPPAKKMIVLERKLACSPCYGTRCRILTHACMREILPAEVMKKIEELMENK